MKVNRSHPEFQVRMRMYQAMLDATEKFLEENLDLTYPDRNPLELLNLPPMTLLPEAPITEPPTSSANSTSKK